MCANMRLLVVVDFSRCTQITDASVASLATLKSLRALTLDGCTLVSDDGLEELKNVRESLEVLSLANVATITDEGLGYVGQYCRLLTSINVNNCAQISSVGLFKVAKGCKRLVCMLASSTYIDDDGIARISASLSKKYFDTMDISFCRDITDHGIGKSLPLYAYLS
jgi:F-box and leucine-rich repeat protein 2/20